MIISSMKEYKAESSGMGMTIFRGVAVKGFSEEMIFAWRSEGGIDSGKRSEKKDSRFSCQARISGPKFPQATKMPGQNLNCIKNRVIKVARNY